MCILAYNALSPEGLPSKSRARKWPSPTCNLRACIERSVRDDSRPTLVINSFRMLQQQTVKPGMLHAYNATLLQRFPTLRHLEQAIPRDVHGFTANMIRVHLMLFSAWADIHDPLRLIGCAPWVFYTHAADRLEQTCYVVRPSDPCHKVDWHAYVQTHQRVLSAVDPLYERDLTSPWESSTIFTRFLRFGKRLETTHSTAGSTLTL